MVKEEQWLRIFFKGRETTKETKRPRIPAFSVAIAEIE
jgi:hypothetical protein